MSRHVAELALYTDRALLCVEGYDEGVHLGEATGLLRTEIEPSDRLAPTDGTHKAEAVAALRGLFVETDSLVASGPSLEKSDRAGLRRLFDLDPAEGAKEFARRGLRWQTRDLEPAGSLTPRGDVLETRVTTFTLRVRAEAPLLRTSINWASLEGLWSAWSQGELLLSPTCAEVVRRLRSPGSARSSKSMPRSWAVAPHIEMFPVRTPTLPPATHTNVFLVGTDSAVLVEPATPYPDELDRIEAWLTAAKERGIHVSAILATHHHIDHIGGATALAERLDVPLCAHALTQERLEGLVVFDRILGDEERLELDGEVPSALIAMHTPGHAPGHLCFRDELTGIMIAGDMVAGVGTILIEPNDGDMRLYLDSLRVMASAEPTALLPAHGGVIRNPQKMLEFYIAHRLMREAKVLDALSSAGPGVTPAELLPIAYDDTPKAAWPLAELSIEAHLIKLERDGRVAHANDGWRVA